MSGLEMALIGIFGMLSVAATVMCLVVAARIWLDIRRERRDRDR